jgi:hypothetical protein
MTHEDFQKALETSREIELTVTGPTSGRETSICARRTRVVQCGASEPRRRKSVVDLWVEGG